MIVGALQMERPERTFKSLLAPTGIASQLAAATAAMRLLPVRRIGIETLLDGVRRQPQRLSADS